MVIPSLGFTVIDRAAVTVCTGLLESVACTVKLDVSAVEAVPVIAPLVFSVSPAGSAPPTVVNV